MIASMTGFGKASVEYDGRKIAVEIRSINSRFLDLSLRLPRTLSEFELSIREYIRSKINRGKVSVNISINGNSEKGEFLVLNEDNAKIYYNMANQLKEQFDLPGEIDLNLMLSFPDLLTKEEETFDTEKILELVKQLLDDAFVDLNKMRFAEGERLADDMKSKIETLEKELVFIESRAAKRISKRKDELKEKVAKLMGDLEIDEQRLAMEIVLLADKMDITEECVRFHSHNEQFLNFINQGSPIGKKLNFLAQEMHREANTIGSKANDSELTFHVINMKDEIEKIREQIQNIE